MKIWNTIIGTKGGEAHTVGSLFGSESFCTYQPAHLIRHTYRKDGMAGGHVNKRARVIYFHISQPFLEKNKIMRYQSW